MSLFLGSSWGWVSSGTEGRAGLLAEVYSDLREPLVLLLLWEGSPRQDHPACRWHLNFPGLGERSQPDRGPGPSALVSGQPEISELSLALNFQSEHSEQFQKALPVFAWVFSLQLFVPLQSFFSLFPNWSPLISLIRKEEAWLFC